MADACLVPPESTDATVDRVLAWSTMPLDRHRLRDRRSAIRGVFGLHPLELVRLLGIIPLPTESNLPTPDYIKQAAVAALAEMVPSRACAISVGASPRAAICPISFSSLRPLPRWKASS